MKYKSKRILLETNKEFITKKSEDNFHTICVILGSNCNFKCRYCMQHTGIKSPINSTDNFELIKDFIVRTKPKRLLLWGGEPLMYWEQFRELVMFVRSHFKDCEVNTITNGSLLTEEKVKFINEYNVGVGISNDGYATEKTRYVDVLKNPEIFRLYSEIESKGINTVLSAKTQDVYEVWEYYDKLFAPYFVNVNFDILKNFKNDEELGNFDFDKFQITLSKLKKDFIDDVLNERYEGRAFLFFKPLLNLANHQMVSANSENIDVLYHLKCGTMTNVIVIDFHGNVYMCKNSDKIIGNIDNIENARKELYKEVKIPIWCKECPYLFICDPAGCVVENEDNKMESCKINKMIYGTFLEALKYILSIRKI
ncbi:radical SAM/SPASM domain-containing protein [Phascolarctobacterium faecium]|uniref:radical SAM/SPASM domain-containing protein n=1 Tax=Phascolarctobacterium faecium TaxID=33025 RepID=UPI00243011F3|nr:radical SAM protein [Phascolarctobacterium faecium]